MIKDHARLGKHHDKYAERSNVGKADQWVYVHQILETGVFYTRGRDRIVYFADWKQAEEWEFQS